MQEFQIIDERKYPLPGLINKNSLPYYRWEHRATISYRGRKFIAIVDNGIKVNNKVYKLPTSYVEDITSGIMEQIKDNNLWVALTKFLTVKGFFEIQLPIQKELK